MEWWLTHRLHIWSLWWTIPANLNTGKCWGWSTQLCTIRLQPRDLEATIFIMGVSWFHSSPARLNCSRISIGLVTLFEFIEQTLDSIGSTRQCVSISIMVAPGLYSEIIRFRMNPIRANPNYSRNKSRSFPIKKKIQIPTSKFCIKNIKSGLTRLPKQNSVLMTQILKK